MLNDLLAIERGLTANGVDLVGRHPDVKDVAKGSALRVRLAEGGHVSSVEVIPEAGNGAVWTLRDGQHNGFPGLKTAAGLLALDAFAREKHDRAWNSSKSPPDRRNELMRLFSEHSVAARQIKNWPNSGHRKRISERLEALRTLADDPLSASVPAVFERFLAALDVSPSFLEQLTNALGERVRNNGDDYWIDPIRTALIAPIVLAIDVKDMEFQRDAGDARQIGAISRALSNPPSTGNEQIKGEAVCALTGKAAKLHAGNFPQPNLPGLGQTYIYSRNRDIPSLTRYGRTADASFQADAELVRRLAGAIAALTREDRKGKTWRLIPAESGDKSDLLVVSTADPGAHYADAVADDDELSGEAALKELASRAIDQSKGIFEHGQPEDQVLVLVLRTVDPANRKSIYQRRATSARFWTAARDWQSATVNTPDWLRFPFPGKAKAEVILRGPPYVTPLSITPISRVQFANGGRRPIEVIGIPASQAFQLFLKEGDIERRARDLLHLLVERHGDLLAGVAAARTKGTEFLKDFDPKAGLRRNALQSATWIGALLYHLDRLKEVYMSDAGFRLGQLLAAADIVHVGYCKDVRDGSIPPTLLGNALLGMAAERPHDALKLLLKRWPPYAAWAKRKARWVLREIEPIAMDLREKLGKVEGRPDEYFQAELLLGYMAGLPRGTEGAGDASHAEGQNDVNRGESA
ncbi:hypothetical protein [Blastochloris viridis]|uniref:Uncharacterized protein n=1 Tax=Blastochloris viridis TaxID=1079 RepID=A0A0H5BQF4_BLAVI|nr:hypothetical protein [Blastochloris viridis]ALK09274.1 hypothetical protein BVIR_1491 [Blastochloris viridis]BAS00854.1 hypothetical protein BV133_3260 [Blastochloris viridis]CUU41937.1 hypothetical protein BVIRIDIS_09360 [Blastochloris viridis]